MQGTDATARPLGQLLKLKHCTVQEMIPANAGTAKPSPPQAQAAMCLITQVRTLRNKCKPHCCRHSLTNTMLDWMTTMADVSTA